MKYHVHVYKVIAKAEIEVDAKNDADARQQALDKRDILTYTQSDCKHIAMEFKIGEKEKK